MKRTVSRTWATTIGRCMCCKACILYDRPGRPDYQKLSVLRKLFPRVPVLALSATCPPKVLKDLMLILQMKQPIQNGNCKSVVGSYTEAFFLNARHTAAGLKGTIYFSAPLYRKNLHYKVVPKLAKGADAISAMRTYILENHKGHSGIVYCLSKKVSGFRTCLE